MRRFFAIVGREWRAYFLSPLAYVILAAFLVMNGLIFYAIVSFLNTLSDKSRVEAKNRASK